MTQISWPSTIGDTIKSKKRPLRSNPPQESNPNRAPGPGGAPDTNEALDEASRYNPDDENYDSSDSEHSERLPKRPKLPKDIPVDLYNKLFTHSSAKPKHKRETAVCFPVEAQPSWVNILGEAFLNELGTWVVEIPDLFVAHVAGHNNSVVREFDIHTNTNLLSDIFALINSNVSRCPQIPKLRKPQFALINTVRAQIKATSLTFVLASKQFSLEWNLGSVQHLVLPTVWSSIEALRSSVKALRSSVLPGYIPFSLQYKFVNAPLSSIWPTSDDVLNPLRQFFRVSELRRGRSRGYSRGGRSRSRSNRGSSRGYSRGRGRGSQRGGSQADSNRAKNANQ